MDRKCKNKPDMFYHICGNVVLSNDQAKIADFVKKAYGNYFGLKLEDQDHQFAPNVCYKASVENLRDRRNDESKNILFAISMVWKVGKDHITCYLCLVNLKGINCKKKLHVHIPMFLQ